jgi:hypothetical protein
MEYLKIEHTTEMDFEEREIKTPVLWDLWLHFPSEGRCAADFYCP